MKNLQNCKYRVLNVNAAVELLSMVGFSGATPERQFANFIYYLTTERDVKEIKARFAKWLNPDGMNQFRRLGHHGNNAQTTHGLCRFLCETLEIELISIRRGRAEKRYNAYKLNPEIPRQRIDRARHLFSWHKPIKHITREIRSTPSAPHTGAFVSLPALPGQV